MPSSVPSTKIKPQSEIETPALKRITLMDVAARAGVQKACVSVVLNGAKSNAHVSPSARERILQAAEELGYKRNAGMSSIASGRFGCVALLLSTHSTTSTLPTRLWNGIHDSLAAQSIHLSLFRLPDEELTNEEKLPKILREWMADGMLIDYTHGIPKELKQLITGHSLPAIWLNSKQDFDCARPDDFGAGMAATEHLLRLGHRRITHINLFRSTPEGHEHYSVSDRYAGYQQAMRAAGVTPNVLFGNRVMHQEQAALIGELLQDPAKRPTAIFAYGSEVNAVLWAASRQRLEVPRDLSVINFDPDAKAWSGVPLTSYLVPEFEIGKCAAIMIQEKIADPQRKLKSIILPFVMQEGESIAPPIFRN